MKGELENDWINAERDALELPQETRQKVMADVWGGAQLGVIARAHGLPLSTVVGIVNLNINREEVLTLNKESV